MRLTSWECSTGKFVVVRLHKTNILLPCEGDLVQEVKKSHGQVVQQPSTSLGLLSDSCHVVLVSSPVELLCLHNVLPQFPFQRHLPDIYCTRDCLRVAEQLRAELKPLEHNTGSLSDSSDDECDNSFTEPHSCKWRLDDVLKAVKELTFGQVCYINDVEVQASAHPSGTGIGCAAWVINTPTCRLGYIPKASLHHPFAAVMSLDPIQKLDVLLSGPACIEADQQLPCSMQTLLTEVCHLVVATLKAGGNVLLPVLLTGTALALLEQVPAALQSCGLAPSHTPVLYISPAATRALTIGMTAADSLNHSRQQAVLAGQHPFPFYAAVKAGHLLVADSLADEAVQTAWKAPACVFVSAVSLEHGAGSQLLKKWAYEDTSQVILTEPTMLQGAQESLKAQLPPDFCIKVCAPAGAPGLSSLELAHLLQASQPDHLILPHAAMGGLKSLPPHSRGMLAKTAVHEYQAGQTVKVPTPPFAPSAVLTSQMAATVKMQKLTDEFAGVRLSCQLQFQDDQWQVVRSQLPAVSMDPNDPMPQPCLWGRVPLHLLLGRLEKQGAEIDVQLDSDTDGGLTIVHILNWDATIRLSATKTEIEARTSSQRHQLGKVVVEVVNSF